MLPDTGPGPATIEFERTGLTVVRFRGDVKLTSAVLAEVMQAARPRTLAPCAAIALLPDGMDHDMDLLAVDHFTANGVAHRITALAIVCQELGLIPLLRLYFAYHPASFNIGFCASLDEARTWMRQQARLMVPA
jgi:hypothetical protein